MRKSLAQTCALGLGCLLLQTAAAQNTELQRQFLERQQRQQVLSLQQRQQAELLNPQLGPRQKQQLQTLFQQQQQRQQALHERQAQQLLETDAPQPITPAPSNNPALDVRLQQFQREQNAQWQEFEQERKALPPPAEN